MPGKNEQPNSGDTPPKGKPRLSFEESSGWYEFGRIPYKIYYMLSCPSTDLIDEKHPGGFDLTADLGGGGRSLSIWIHESVPDEFKDIVMFHELREAELRYADELDKNGAHRQAVSETEAYARQHLNEEKLAKFLEWQSTIEM